MADPYADFSSPQNADPYAAFSSKQGNDTPQADGSPIWNGIKSVASDAADFYRRATNYRDTQTVKAAAGIGGIPRAIGDVTNWVGSKFGLSPHDTVGVPYIGALATLSQLPGGQEISDSLLKQAEKVPNFKERNINPIVDAGTQALLAGPVLGAGGKFAPLINFGGGAGSEAGGEAGHYLDERLGTNLEPYLRIAGAILGGGGGLGAGAATTKAKGCSVPPGFGSTQCRHPYCSCLSHAS